MIRGTTVTVKTPNVTGADRLNNPVYGAPTQTTVGNVLVEPLSTAGLGASRPDGATVSVRLHFPKTFTGDLRGCEVVVPNYGTYRVVGEPKPYMAPNTPTDWCLYAECELCHG